jgi:hypothetical protein
MPSADGGITRGSSSFESAYDDPEIYYLGIGHSALADPDIYAIQADDVDFDEAPDIDDAEAIGNILSDEQPGARGRWMRDEIRVTILADAVNTCDLPRVSLFGRTEVQDSFCVVIGDDGRLEHRVTRDVGEVEFDAGMMRQELGFVARWALRHLVADPDSMLFNGIFQAVVWAANEEPSTTEVVPSGTAGPMQVAIFDCQHVVTGDDINVTIHDDRSQDSARVSLARLVPGHPSLVRALARTIAEPGDPVAAAALDAAVVRAAAGMPEEAMLAAATVDGSAAARVGLTGGALTAEGATAVAIGSGTEAMRTSDVTVEAIAITGVWPDGTAPPAQPSPQRWNGLDWYLFDEKRLRQR